MRVQIAAQALGTAFAVYDYVCAHRPSLPGPEAELAKVRLDAAETLLLRAAAEVDRNPDENRAPSLAELHTARLAVETTRWAENALGPETSSSTGCSRSGPATYAPSNSWTARAQHPAPQPGPRPGPANQGTDNARMTPGARGGEERDSQLMPHRPVTLRTIGAAFRAP
jgi:alkylation response protein AidB-like acyl-CoA dehydrogenase